MKKLLLALLISSCAPRSCGDVADIQTCEDVCTALGLRLGYVDVSIVNGAVASCGCEVPEKEGSDEPRRTE